MKICLLLAVLVVLSLAQFSCSAGPKEAVAGAPPVPEGLGVNIHFTDGRPGEMKMLAEGGFQIVRMDFGWGGTEKKKGEYDFSAFDRLMAALDRYKIRALFILDYGNGLYDDGNSPHSDAGRKAFAAWAAAGVKHFRGRRILWEMWNEPNIGFWKPKPNVEDYIKLALEVGKAIRQADPNEAYIGPGTSGVEFTFLEACFKAGLLEYWSAVSVHPYRQTNPETAAADYARLRRMIDRYAPKGKHIPILSGEWGYSSVWNKFDEDRQGRYLPRQWMTNLANDVPVSIWYDWHDDGKDPKESEHHFGTVLNPYDANKDPVYQPKPAYLAARTLTSALRGFRFNKRLAMADANDCVLLFSKDEQVRLAAWTISATPRAILIPASPGKFTVTGHTGEAMPPLTAEANGLSVTVTDAPQYLAPQAPNDLLRLAAAWERAPAAIHMPAKKGAVLSLSLRNPLSRNVRVMIRPGAIDELPPGGSASVTAAFDLPPIPEPVPVRFRLAEQGGAFEQETQVYATNPLRLTILPAAGKSLTVRVENPSGEPFQGTAALTDLEGLKATAPKGRLELKAGQTEKLLRFAVDQGGAADYRVGVRVEDPQGEPQLALPAARFSAVDDFSRYTADTLAEAYRAVADGDPNVLATQALAVGLPPEGPPAEGVGALKITYNCEKGWKFVRLAPQTDALKKIDGQPKALGLWICGDGSGNSPRLRFTDSTGQTFQPTGESLKWKGWRYVTFPMTSDKLAQSHWGGANDGVIHYPIRWDSLFLLDKPKDQKSQGTVFIAAPTLVR